MSNGKSDYSGRECDCVAVELVSNGIAVTKLVCPDEVSIVCFTEGITQAIVNFYSEPCLVTTRVEVRC